MKQPKIGAGVVDAGFGRGFGAVDLSQMKEFYLLWPSERILQTASEESPSQSRHQAASATLQTVSGESGDRKNVLSASAESMPVLASGSRSLGRLT